MINFKPHERKDVSLRVKWLNNKKAAALAIENPEKETTAAEQEDWFNRYEADHGKNFFTIFDDKKPIGFMGLSGINSDKKTASVFILIGEDEYRGRGVGVVSMNYLIKKAFNELRLKKLTLEVDKLNVGAIKLYSKLGFKIIGENEREFKMTLDFFKISMPSVSKNNFKNLVKYNGYQVFLFTCPVSIPLNFASHPWFVCVKNGEISRWEVRFEKNKINPSLGKHLHFNSLPPFSGIEMLQIIPKKFLWPANLVGYIEGGEDSLAKKIIDFIETSSRDYIYRNQYSFIGPNSNTYAQWVLNNFPDFKIKLLWNSFGKNFKLN